MTISNETQTIEQQLGLIDESEEEVQEPRPIAELLKLNTFQGMSDEEITSLIKYCAEKTAKQTEEEVKMSVKESIYGQMYDEAKKRHERIRARQPHYAITNGAGEVVGYTNDTEETE